MSGIVQIGGVALASHDSGTDKVSLDSGTVFPAGHVLNVVQAVETETDDTTSGSFEQCAGLSVTIIPSSMSSKILVLCDVNLGNHVADYFTHYRIVRDTTPIHIGDAAGDRVRATGVYRDGSPQTIGNLGGKYLDSPNKDTATIYKIEWRVETGGGSVGYLNRTMSDTDNTVYPRTASSITVMEISG